MSGGRFLLFPPERVGRGMYGVATAGSVSYRGTRNSGVSLAGLAVFFFFFCRALFSPRGDALGNRLFGQTGGVRAAMQHRAKCAQQARATRPSSLYTGGDKRQERKTKRVGTRPSARGHSGAMSNEQALGARARAVCLHGSYISVKTGVHAQNFFRCILFRSDGEGPGGVLGVATDKSPSQDSTRVQKQDRTKQDKTEQGRRDQPRRGVSGSGRWEGR